MSRNPNDPLLLVTRVTLALQRVQAERGFYGIASYRPESVHRVARQGSVDILAVEPSKQGTGLGSLMLRKAEGILLNFRSR